MEDSVFTKIIKGELPSHKIYEDETTVAFLDIYPVQPGMVVVASKRQVENFYELEGAEYESLWQTVRKVALKLHQEFPAKKRISVQVEGLDVAHVHVKLFPIDTAEELHARADTANEPDHEALAQMAEKLQVEAV